MMHKAWSSIEELPYCFSRSSVNFQGHIALKIVEFDPNWAFPDCNSSLNAPMAMKCCTKLETAKKRCPIVFQGHPSDFKVTGDKTSPILTQIRHFRTIGRSQLSNPSDLPCFNTRVITTGLLQMVVKCITHGEKTIIELSINGAAYKQSFTAVLTLLFLGFSAGTVKSTTIVVSISGKPGHSEKCFTKG